MTLPELIRAQKPGRIKDGSDRRFGTIVEKPDGIFMKYPTDLDLSAYGALEAFAMEHRRLSVLEIFSTDWEVERLPRTYYLGVTKIQSHMNLREVLMAVETPDGLPPKGPTQDNQPWIKVVEILD